MSNDEVTRRLAAAGLAGPGGQPPMPPQPPKSHSTELLDAGWSMMFGAAHTGQPSLILHAVDGSRSMVYIFDDIIQLAGFANNLEKFREAWRANLDAATKATGNGGMDSDSGDPAED